MNRLYLTTQGTEQFVVILWSKIRDEFYQYPIAHLYTCASFEDLVDCIADHIRADWNDRVSEDIAETYEWSKEEEEYGHLVYPPDHDSEYQLRAEVFDKSDRDQYLRNVLQLIMVWDKHSAFTFDIIHSGNDELYGESEDVWISSVQHYAEHP